MDKILKYFTDLTLIQINQFEHLETLYATWNSQINVVSRKDINQLYVRHILHSLGIAKVQVFKPKSQILDVGTGGGFPGIPLAILFPDTQFYLIDAIAKKIKVVQAITDKLGLNNVKVAQIRAEKVNGKYDFIVSRAVTNMTDFVKWTRKKVAKKQNHELKNGILYLKGGNLTKELMPFPKAQQFDLSNYFDDAFFETKKVVHLTLKYKR